MAARSKAREILAAAIRGAEPRGAVQRAILEQSACRALLARVNIAEGDSSVRNGAVFNKVILTGQGKAAVQMCSAALEQLQKSEPKVSGAVKGGLIVTKHGHVSSKEREELAKASIRVAEAGHPLPDAEGVKATSELLQLAEEADERTLVLNFISGGGSALTCLPAEGLSLEDIQKTVELLLGSGAPIEDMNTVRRHLTLFQGGRFAASLYPATVVSFILSDVVGDPLEVIAGGSTSPDPTSFEDCKEILKDPSYGIASAIPPAVWTFLDQDKASLDVLETCKPGSTSLEKTTNLIVASNRESLLAAKTEATKMGYNAKILTSQMQGEARHAASFLVGIARDARDQGTFGKLPACILVGGETTVTLSREAASGLGGRNQELALAAAISLSQEHGITLLAAGTDGQDGPCDAAGAVVDGEVCRSREELARAKKHLASHNSYGFFQDSEAHIKVGPTGTNVMDLCILLVE